MSLAEPEPLPHCRDNARLGSDLPTPSAMADPVASRSAPSSSAAAHPLVFLAVTLVVGVGAGLGGMLLALLLHLIQHLAYGYSLHAIISPVSLSSTA